jgi:hypothetical protein
MDLGLLVLRIVLPIDVARRRLVRGAERGIADLRREVVFEVEEAGLAHVARFGTRLADDRRLVAHARARVPAEDGEGACARSAFASKLLLRLFTSPRWRRFKQKTGSREAKVGDDRTSLTIRMNGLSPRPL